MRLICTASRVSKTPGACSPNPSLPADCPERHHSSHKNNKKAGTPKKRGSGPKAPRVYTTAGAPGGAPQRIITMTEMEFLSGLSFVLVRIIGPPSFVLQSCVT